VRGREQRSRHKRHGSKPEKARPQQRRWVDHARDPDSHNREDEKEAGKRELAPIEGRARREPNPTDAGNTAPVANRSGRESTACASPLVT
jgi:hypothetical protein